MPVLLYYSLESCAQTRLSVHSRAIVLPVPLTLKAKGMGHTVVVQSSLDNAEQKQLIQFKVN